MELLELLFSQLKLKRDNAHRKLCRVKRDLNPHYDIHTELIYKLREKFMRSGVSSTQGQSAAFKNEFQNMP